MATYTEERQHLTLRELKDKSELEYNQYLAKVSPGNRYFIPDYPRPEIHVTRLSHSTDLEGLKGIRAARGFRGFKGPNIDWGLVWFSLEVTPEDLSDAENRTMKIVRPGEIEEDFTPMAGDVEQGLLTKFSSSPAFLSSSRYGSYRFTFDLQDVLDRYSEQFCGGEVPVMRKWKTVVYKQEVLYAVLVHSPSDKRFSQYPLLEEPPHNICEFRDGPEPHFIWRPQAMSEKHRFELQTEDNTLFASYICEQTEQQRQQFYVWDHVSLALVVDYKVLRFTSNNLRKNLWFCERGARQAKPETEFQSYEDANRAVHGYDLWPYSGDLWEFKWSPFHIFPPN